MEIVNSTVRAAGSVGGAATATLGAVSGAAIGGVVGSIKGAAEGATAGARRGSHSTPAAALTLGAVALTGVVQWPVVAVAGGTALVLNQFKPGKSGAHTPKDGTKTQTGQGAGSTDLAATPVAPTGPDADASLAATPSKTAPPAGTSKATGRKVTARTSNKVS